MDLDFVRIECEIVTDVPAQLTAALYSVLRNFEAHFRACSCPTLQESCTSCRQGALCPYRAVFGQELSSDPTTVRLHQKPSLPFSLYIDGIDGIVSSCPVGVVVIGTAVNYIGHFHAALLRMVETVAAALLPPAETTLCSYTYSLDYQGARHEIKRAESLPESVILLSGRHILLNTVHSGNARLLFKSPLHILCNGSIMHHFDFDIFFRTQLRRCSSLYAYYGTGEMDLDFMRLSKAAPNIAVSDDKTVYTQPPWSKLKNRGGLIGTFEFSGLIEPMFSLLLLGSYFNAGKGATFGSGVYQLEVAE